MDTSRDQTPSEEEEKRLITEAREYWTKRLNLTPGQGDKLSVPLMRQLAKCKTDEARRLIMSARMAGHEWMSKSARRGH